METFDNQGNMIRKVYIKHESSTASSSNSKGSQKESVALPVRKSGGQLKCVKLRPNAKLPERGSNGAAGLDLFACDKVEVPAKGQVQISTGIALQIPKGCYARIAPRSGLTIKHLLDIKAGVIDRDYRGDIQVVLYNYGTSDYTIHPGDKVAQLLLEVIEEMDVEVVESLEETERGIKGFGSTGYLSLIHI